MDSSKRLSARRGAGSEAWGFHTWRVGGLSKSVMSRVMNTPSRMRIGVMVLVSLDNNNYLVRG